VWRAGSRFPSCSGFTGRLEVASSSGSSGRRGTCRRASDPRSSLGWSNGSWHTDADGRLWSLYQVRGHTYSGNGTLKRTRVPGTSMHRVCSEPPVSVLIPKAPSPLHEDVAAEAVVATGRASADADRDNGISLHSTPRFRGCDEHATNSLGAEEMICHRVRSIKPRYFSTPWPGR
jgi:hypothetical protein